MKLETQKLGFYRTSMKFWIYHMRQVVKKETDAKSIAFCFIKPRFLFSGYIISWLWNTWQEFIKKSEFLNDFWGNLMFETDIIFGNSPITPRATLIKVYCCMRKWSMKIKWKALRFTGVRGSILLFSSVCISGIFKPSARLFRQVF